jgi:type III polyketide synthase
MATIPEVQDVPKEQFGDLNLSITGMGVEYPPYMLSPPDLDTLVARHYPDSPA